MSKTGAMWMIAILLLAGAWAVARVYVYSTEAGDVFPEYSSLRADPKGARALHDSLATLPGMQVWRWFKPLDEIATSSATVLFLNESPWSLRAAGVRQRKEWEQAADRGLRLVFALAPEPKRRPRPRKQTDEKKEEEGERPELNLEKEWKIVLRAGKTGGPVTLETSDPAWAFHDDASVERVFGKGSIVILNDAYPFSNEALRDDRDSPFILWTLGNRSEVIFDEYHLGTQETGSVGMLLRRYHLEGAALGLVALGVLFLWRMSTSLVPPSPQASQAPVSGRDSAAALASLLRRNVPVKQIPATTRELWQGALPLLAGLSQERRARVEQELAATADPTAMWRRIHDILTRRT
ncbi:MAG: DUF4350 domain-containing protein [Bryobacteraceae bacterium]